MVRLALTNKGVCRAHGEAIAGVSRGDASVALPALAELLAVALRAADERLQTECMALLFISTERGISDAAALLDAARGLYLPAAVEMFDLHRAQARPILSAMN
jgi:hypothetical protein